MRAPRYKILIVDDQQQVRRLLEETLSATDYEILTTENGESALLILERERPHVVLLDIMMPGRYDGLAVCRHVKSDEVLRNSKVILVTARAQQTDIAAGAAAGADAYITKPFSPLSLILKIESLLAGTEHAGILQQSPH